MKKKYKKTETGLRKANVSLFLGTGIGQIISGECKFTAKKLGKMVVFYITLVKKIN